MPQVINVTEDDIQFAEQLLLPSGKKFDRERVDFICNFKTIDLQAVPGSGKTTALLAKLIILERKLPFADGSGILVLSHTNAAIDEIKDKIQKHCPRLFSYPNFIGTIQGFVDEFLAVPMYIQWKRKKPVRIDSEIFWEVLKKKLPHGTRLALEKRLGNTFQNFIEDLTIGKNNKLVHFETLEEVNIPKIGSHTDSYKKLYSVKKELLDSGILNYNDAYTFANSYVKKYPIIKTLLQKRFSFVFVDEMQDMDSHQYNLLENIFFDERNSVSIIQRIGDKNQAIYNSVKATDVWIDRAEILRLNGSQRLSKPIADVVKKFALYHDPAFDIVGINECEIKPHILVFDNITKNSVIPYFAQIVTDHKENGKLKSKKDFKDIKVVCWNTGWKEDETSRNDENKIRLEDYHKGFKKEKSKPKQDYDNLKSYLMYYETKKTLEPVRKNILNAFLKILRLENIYTADNRPYTKKKLIDFIHDTDIQKHDELNLKLYNWSMGIIQEKTNEVWNEIQLYIPTLLAMHDKKISKSSTFVHTQNAVTSDNVEMLTPTNHYKVDGLEIEITSVHAVKGQTHCATLYLESFFKNGYGHYESERLRNQFIGKQTITETLASAKNSHELIKQSAKMAYVGLSRPTDLLCVAVHKVRFDKFMSQIDRDLWNVIEVPNN